MADPDAETDRPITQARPEHVSAEVEYRRRIDPIVVSDKDLLRGCGDDADLFGVFYRRHSAALLTYFMHRTSCAQTAADLASETFAAALVSRERFQETHASARPWLFGIGRNLLGKYLRRERVSRKYQRRLAAQPVELSISDIARVEELADLQALRPQIKHAMETLPEKQARAVQLRVIEQQDYASVAVALGVSEGAARVRVSRGLTRLAELLEDER